MTRTQKEDEGTLVSEGMILTPRPAHQAPPEGFTTCHENYMLKSTLLTQSPSELSHSPGLCTHVPVVDVPQLQVVITRTAYEYIFM